jgi:hypothetical protein
MKHIILVLFVCTTVFAQKKFKVVDSMTKAPIPYAGINLNNGYGMYSDEDGNVTITDASVAEIAVSAVGYIEKRVAVSAITDVIVMEIKPIQLKEVIVSKKKTKKREKAVKSVKHQNELFMSSVGLQYAFLISAESPGAYLTKISLPLIKIAFETEDTEFVFQRVPFYTLMKVEVLENNSRQPGDKLYDFEQLVVVNNIDNDKQFDILLSEELPIDERGMFIQFTILGRANADGSLQDNPGYIMYKDEKGAMKKFARYCQPNFPLSERPKGPLTYIRRPFANDNSWKTINEPHLHAVKKYPNFNIGFGYTVISYE